MSNFRLSNQEAQVRTFSRWGFDRWLSGATAAAILALVALTGTVRTASAQEESKWKDQAEYDIADAAGKDIAAQNGAKGLEDLNSWKQKYADSFYKNNREVMYIQ